VIRQPHLHVIALDQLYRFIEDDLSIADTRSDSPHILRLA